MILVKLTGFVTMDGKRLKATEMHLVVNPHGSGGGYSPAYREELQTVRNWVAVEMPQYEMEIVIQDIGVVAVL